MSVTVIKASQQYINRKLSILRHGTEIPYSNFGNMYAHVCYYLLKVLILQLVINTYT